MKRWSKLQSEIYNIIDRNLNLQIHCSVNQKKTQKGSINLPRYWVTLNREIIFDYPKNFVNHLKEEGNKENIYPYVNSISDISKLLREYIDTSLSDLLSKEFLNDYWGITDVLKASDRRIGTRRLNKLRVISKNPAVRIIIDHRISKKTTT